MDKFFCGKCRDNCDGSGCQCICHTLPNDTKIQELMNLKAKELTQEKRQEILDLFKKGVCIGDVAKQLCNGDSDIVCGVINLNIKSMSYLREESV